MSGGASGVIPRSVSVEYENKGIVVDGRGAPYEARFICVNANSI